MVKDTLEKVLLKVTTISHFELFFLILVSGNSAYFACVPARAFFNSFRKDHEMIHLRDLQKLEGVLVPSHLEVFKANLIMLIKDSFFLIFFLFFQLSCDLGSYQEMEFARSLRQSKVNIKICQVN